MTVDVVAITLFGVCCNIMNFLDLLNAIFWSIVYCIIIYNGIKYRSEQKLMIPFAACSLNFAWETVAFVQFGFWGHALWLLLDIFIFALNISLIVHKSKKPTRHVFMFVGLTMTAILVFCITFNINLGMLCGSFIINLFMSILFIVCRRLIFVKGKVSVAIFKLLGTLCATLVYMSQLGIVAIMGWIIFVLDVFYLSICLEEKSREMSRKGGRINGMVYGD